MRFEDRRHAGEKLAEEVVRSSPQSPVVYALPRGGVPVGYEVAKALDCPLDVLEVAKVGLPGQPELALGAVSVDETVVLNENLLRQVGMTESQFRELADRARQRLGGRWSDNRSPQSPVGRTAVIVDDGLATGATARVAAEVMRAKGAEAVWLAVPVCPSGTREAFSDVVDRFVSVHEPRRFVAVGNWYRDFAQTSDEEVERLLSR